MPFAFLIIGILMIVVGIRGQTSNAIALLQSEFSTAAKGSFTLWFVAIFIVGAIGYYKPARPFSDAFLLLIILAMVMSNQTQNNLFAVFNEALTSSPANTAASNATPPATTSQPTNYSLPNSTFNTGANSGNPSVTQSGTGLDFPNFSGSSIQNLFGSTTPNFNSNSPANDYSFSDFPDLLPDFGG